MEAIEGTEASRQPDSAAPHVDPIRWRAELYAAGNKAALGMIEAPRPPTPGLMSYLHDPARHAYRWHRRAEFGGEADPKTDPEIVEE